MSRPPRCSTTAITTTTDGLATQPNSPSTNYDAPKVKAKKQLAKNSKKRKVLLGGGKKTKKKVPPTKKRKKVQSRAQFVVKIFQFLQQKRLTNIVSWHEDSFVVWKRKEFAEKVLPKLFNHQNFSSFERQMNFYNFSKMSVDADMPSKLRMKKTDPCKFKHRCFTPNSTLEEVQKITRTTAPIHENTVKETLLWTQEKNKKTENDIRKLTEMAAMLRAQLDLLPALPAPVVELGTAEEEAGYGHATMSKKNGKQSKINNKCSKLKGRQRNNKKNKNKNKNKNTTPIIYMKENKKTGVILATEAASFNEKFDPLQLLNILPHQLITTVDVNDFGEQNDGGGGSDLVNLSVFDGEEAQNISSVSSSSASLPTPESLEDMQEDLQMDVESVFSSEYLDAFQFQPPDGNDFFDEWEFVAEEEE
jgi:hypothetical protein